MGRNGKPSENKVQAPKVASKGGKTKHRKGGEKARKLGPQRRLERTFSKFLNTSAELTAEKQHEADRIKRQVSMGLIEPMSGGEFQDKLNRPRHKHVNPKKIARLLMPNAGY